MHLVSDFDGVWTDPRAEADAIRDLMVTLLSDSTSLSIERIKEIFAEIEKNFVLNPFKYGWLYEEYITAFAMEDLYGRNHAIATCLWQKEPNFPESEALREAIEKIAENADRFSDICFRDGRSQYREKNKTLLLKDAAQVISQIRDADYRMTIVSNSKITHILDLFEAAEISLEGFQIIGGARKFHLGMVGSLPETWQWQEATVSLQRPHYFDLLERLKPDAVVGDVFSLDLSVPLYLRSTRDGWQNFRAGLIKQPYTPSWVANETNEAWAKEQGLDVLDGLGSVPSWLANLSK